MKTIALTAMTIAALGLGACRAGTTNNSANANASSDADNGVIFNSSAAQSTLQNAGQDIGNFASEAGDTIENGAKGAWNEVKEVARDIGDGRDDQGNSTSNKTGR